MMKSENEQHTATLSADCTLLLTNFFGFHPSDIKFPAVTFLLEASVQNFFLSIPTLDFCQTENAEHLQMKKIVL